MPLPHKRLLNTQPHSFPFVFPLHWIIQSCSFNWAITSPSREAGLSPMAEGETPTKQFVKVDQIVVPIHRRLWPRTKSGKSSLDVPEIIRCQLQWRSCSFCRDFCYTRFNKFQNAAEKFVGDLGQSRRRSRRHQLKATTLRGTNAWLSNLQTKLRWQQISAESIKIVAICSTAMCTPSVRAGETARMLSPVVGIVSETTMTWPKRTEVWSKPGGQTQAAKLGI